jgi:hypothetical protein
MKRSLTFAVASLLAAATTAYAVPPATGAPTGKSGDPRERVICRSYTATGTLARIIRTCKTRREWDAQAANIRASMSGSESCRTNGSNGDVICE